MNWFRRGVSSGCQKVQSAVERSEARSQKRADRRAAAKAAGKVGFCRIVGRAFKGAAKGSVLGALDAVGLEVTKKDR